ncbi:hypothetical protein DFJ73DRAFT_135378 [Zopfochytrium polystomum]|nr:hypothetical protein DFJ73DRAFT_135378 [Zopfochytrium polystomum]
MSDANGDDDPPNTSMEEPPNDSEQASKADGQAQEVPANLSDPSPTCKFSRPPRPREDSGRSNRGGWRNGGSWKAGRARQHRNEWGESAHRQHWDTGMNNYNGGDQGSIPRRMTRGKCYQDGMFGNGGSRSGYGDSWDNMVGVGGGPAAYDQSQRHHPYSGPAQLGGLDFSNSRTSHDQNQHPFRRGRGGYAKSHQFEGFRRGSHFSNGSGQHMGNQNIASYGGSPSGFNQNHIPNFQTGPHASLQSPPFSTNPLFAFPGQNSYSTASPQFPNQSSMLGSAINQPFPIDFTGGAIFAGQQLSQQSQLQQSVPFSAAMAFPVLSLQSPVQGPILQSNFLGQQNVQPQLQQQQLQTLHNHQQQQQILLYNAYSCMGLHIASSSSPQPPQLQPSPVVAPLPASPGPSPLPKTPLGAKPTAKKGAFPKSVSAELRPQPQPSKPARKYEIKPRMPGASVFGNNFSIVSEESSSMPVVNSFSSVDSFVDSKPNAEQEVYPGSACEDIDQVEALDSSTAPSLSESKETADMDDDSSDFDCRLHSEREQSMDLDCRRSAADSKSFHSM